MGEKRDDDDANEETQRAEEEIADRSSPSGSIVYQAIRKEGEDELDRPTSALAWSGLAAGLSMGFSLVAEGLLRAHLPDTSWRPLITNFGYSVGFLIVVLGRQQLFTENTLTVILPLLTRRDAKTIRNVIRLWTTVLLSNLAGALAFSWVLSHSAAFDPEIRHTFIALGQEAMRADFWTTLLRGIFAGWLIALMVWLMPFAETSRIWVIIIITYVVGLAGLSHVIAGAVETLYLAWLNRIAWIDAVGGYIIPALLGNIIGGVALVAALNHAQVVAGKTSEDI
jgi:formate/nitrite transporter FocA (FNT family)